jgi:hypothetical protein
VRSADEPLLLADRIATHLENLAAAGPLLIAVGGRPLPLRDLRTAAISHPNM